MKTSKFSCSASRGVGSKSILCVKCKCWIYKKCSEIQITVDFVCRKCFTSTGNDTVYRDVTLDGDVIEKVTKFLHLGDVLCYEAEMQEAVTVRKRS